MAKNKWSSNQMKQNKICLNNDENMTKRKCA